MFDNILDWIFGLIPDAITSRLISKEERKQKHLADIKREVLEPMLKIFDEIYIPVLIEKKPLLICTSQYVTSRGGDVTEHSGQLTSELKVVSPDLEDGLEIFKRDISSQKINQNLYLDIKEKHYKEFIKRYEEFKAEFDSYSKRWLAYAIEIQNNIQRDLGLSPFVGNATQEFFVFYQVLAAYVVERIIGLTPLFIVSDNPNCSSISVQITPDYTTRIAFKGTRSDAENCKELLNRLIKSDTKYDEWRQEREDLLKSAVLLRSGLDKIIKTYKLEGKCDYV